MFLHYANKESDNVIGGCTKTVLKNISLEILKPCSSNLAPEMFITKEKKDTCCDIVITIVIPLVLF